MNYFDHLMNAFGHVTDRNDQFFLEKPNNHSKFDPINESKVRITQITYNQMKNHVSATPSLLGVFVLVALLLGMFATVALQDRGGTEEANGNWKSGKKNVVKEIKDDANKKLINQVKIQYLKFR